MPETIPTAEHGAGHLARQRCTHHASREAAARCPECRRYFCRECITEHEDRVICASCLKQLVGKKTGRLHPLRSLGTMTCLITGFLTLWLCFYALGQMLLAIPTSFHDGAVWGAPSLEE